jgi:hypothetical protein
MPVIPSFFLVSKKLMSPRAIKLSSRNHMPGL